MVSARIVIQNKLGLHARPAMTFTETASRFQASVTVRRCDGDETVDGKSIMQMLLLAGTQGTELEICVDGTDEAAALDALVTLVNRRFDEE
ncbi:MAG: HPr family phosphocarrier protein [Phycisphaeraceae bacterium]|nr:HPr family phosphocarrier protein [Phycisphaeraceae bacterium]